VFGDRFLVHLGERIVDPRVAQFEIHERQPDRHRRERGIEQTAGSLGRLVQPRVVDCQRAADGQRLGEPQVRLRVVAAFGRRQHRQRSDRAAARDQRDDHVRLRAEPLDLLPVLLRDVRRERLADVGRQDRLARLDHAQRLRVLAVLAPAAADVAEQGLDLGVRMNAGDLARPLLVACVDVDRTPVGDGRHRELGDPRQRLFVVERTGERLTRADEELQRLGWGDDRLVGFHYLLRHR
jgi:hypothetical protein